MLNNSFHSISFLQSSFISGHQFTLNITAAPEDPGCLLKHLGISPLFISTGVTLEVESISRITMLQYGKYQNYLFNDSFLCAAWIKTSCISYKKGSRTQSNMTTSYKRSCALSYFIHLSGNFTTFVQLHFLACHLQLSHENCNMSHEK